MMPCHGSDSGREQSRHDLRGLWMFHEHLDGVEKRFSFFPFFFSFFQPVHELEQFAGGNDSSVT